MSVGSNIRKRRVQLRMSQQELADAMGYRTRSTIAKIESGENDVSQKKLVKFAQVLDTTVEMLVSGYATIPEFARDQSKDAEERRRQNMVIILAGGKAGKNMQSIPTQFINVLGKPILVHCMDAYQNHPSIDAIYVVCVKGWEAIVRDYAGQYGITKLRGIISGGASGTASLKNGVEYVRRRYAPEDMVFVQEATRPMVTAETISKLLQVCMEKGSATSCHSMRDHVQFVLSEGKTEYVDRNSLISLQSPEVHRLSLLCDIFDQARQRRHILTESCCTMLMYQLGYHVNFVENSINNVKLIREEDMVVFRASIRL